VDVVIDHLPEGANNLYGHRTRTVLGGPDGKLYLAVGSSCDACVETSSLRGVVVRSNLDGSDLEVFATGLRNTVGLTFRPGSGELWGVDMGRNNLSFALPPEELNLLEEGKDYGWPYCYGNGDPDPEFGTPERCASTETPRFTFPAHSAPLGIVFYNAASGFPPAYRGDALIAFHGSAPDQTDEVKVGYNVLRVRFQDGEPVAQEELLRGFLRDNTPWGRPAGILVAPDGSVLVSDDFGGRIFRVRYVGGASS
jgi:glucose/arabinose dehydrogenase